MGGCSFCDVNRGDNRGYADTDTANNAPEYKVRTTVNGNTIRRTEVNLWLDVPSAITDS